MRSRHHLFLLSVLFLHACLLSEKTCAWEFKMDGTFNYNYEYYCQQGDNGFFGKFNVDRSTGTALLPSGDFAALNGWVGYQVADIVSGADAVKHYQNLQLYPELRVNKALAFRGKYRLGLYGDPIRSEYITNTRPGVDVAASDGQWTMWWVTAQTPWGQIVVGKRPEVFGLGLQYNGAYNNTTEGVALIAPLGAFRISFAVRPFWPHPPNSAISARKTPDNPNVRPVPANPYYNIFDKSAIQQLATRFFATYQDGSIDAGVFLAWQRWHAGDEAKNASVSFVNYSGNPISATIMSGPDGRGRFNPYDLDVYHGTLYVKYDNGRFFFNTEWAYWYETVAALQNPGTGPNPTTSGLEGRGRRFLTESWRRMVEFGAYAGPGKASFLYAYMPGPDRRRGNFFDDQPYFQSPGQGAYGVFRPYCYLLGYAYGSGVNAFDLNKNGYINAAQVLATRLDYAVAANLNVFGSFLWAERSSYGYGWGYVRPTQSATVTRVVNKDTSLPADQIKWTPYVNYQENFGAPSIPSLDLGWEANIGFEWELLDRYKLRALFAYWKPGNWFNYACIDRTIPGWNQQTLTNWNPAPPAVGVPTYPYGVNPDRAIDAIVGGEVALQVEF